MTDKNKKQVSTVDEAMWNGIAAARRHAPNVPTGNNPDPVIQCIIGKAGNVAKIAPAEVLRKYPFRKTFGENCQIDYVADKGRACDIEQLGVNFCAIGERLKKYAALLGDCARHEEAARATEAGEKYDEAASFLAQGKEALARHYGRNHALEPGGIRALAPAELPPAAERKSKTIN